MDLWPVLRWLIAIVSASASALIVVLVVDVVVKRLARRDPRLWQLWRPVRNPLVAVLLSIALRIAFAATATAPSSFRAVSMHVLLIAVIASVVWLVATLVLFWLAFTQRKVVAHKEDDREKRRVHTQLQLIRRLVNAAFVIIGVALVLLTFPGVEQVGAAMLASAGLASVVIGIAAQSSLGNMFAGLQLAFTDAIRFGDVVEVDGAWGTIEDITLSYVVVRIWDERRKVLPSTYFTVTPFNNWSRTGDAVTGTVYFQLDWRVDVAAMRAELTRIVTSSPLWDGRNQSLLLTDSTGDRVTARAVLTTANSDDDFTLRCQVREALVSWLREHDPQALPTQRVLVDPGEEATLAPPVGSG